ncbi:MAG: hypothetical protein IPO57_11305 [Rhodocyclales bacterium]|nr:hypothetical protein [Rhodocyclales bacterium]
MRDAADHGAHGGQLFELQNAPVLAVEAQQLVLEIVLAPVITLDAVEREIEDAEDDASRQQAKSGSRQIIDHWGRPAQ